MVNKGSIFADFVRIRPYTYARTQQSLPPLWVTIKANAMRRSATNSDFGNKRNFSK